MIAECPECESQVEVPESAKLSDAVNCDDCGAELEIESLTPLELILAEDEDDEDCDDDDEL